MMPFFRRRSGSAPTQNRALSTELDPQLAPLISPGDRELREVVLRDQAAILEALGKVADDRVVFLGRAIRSNLRSLQPGSTIVVTERTFKAAYGGEVKTGFPLKILQLSRFGTSSSDCTVEIYTEAPHTHFDIVFDSIEVWSAFMRATGHDPESALR